MPVLNAEVIGELEELIDASQALVNAARRNSLNDYHIFQVGVRYLAWEFRLIVSRINFMEKESDRGSK